MVAIVFDYRNLFDILKSIDFVENCVWLPLCLGPRMHEGQNRVPEQSAREAVDCQEWPTITSKATITKVRYINSTIATSHPRGVKVIGYE